MKDEGSVVERPRTSRIELVQLNWINRSADHFKSTKRNFKDSRVCLFFEFNCYSEEAPAFSEHVRWFVNRTLGYRLLTDLYEVFYRGRSVVLNR